MKKQNCKRSQRPSTPSTSPTASAQSAMEAPPTPKRGEGGGAATQGLETPPGAVPAPLGESDFFSRLSKCKTIPEFQEQIAISLQPLGFSDFSLAILQAPQAKTITTLSSALREYYQQNNLFEYDLLLEHAASSTTPVFLSTLKQYVTHCPFASERLYRNLEWLNQLVASGYQDCYGIPHLYQHNGRRVLFCIFANGIAGPDFRQKVELYKPVLALLIEAIIYFGFTLFPDYFCERNLKGLIPITAKPMRLLSTVATEGLMLKDAATKLCISLDTANKHIAAAKQALGASTLSQAVYLAMLNGLFDQNDYFDDEDEDEEEDSNT